MRIRPGTLGDIEEVSRAYAEAWRTTYQGLTPDAFVNGMTAGAAAQIFRDSLQPNEYSYFFYVAETAEGRIVGFADGGKERSHPESGLGELYAIYLLREFQGQGAGRKLFEAGVESLLKSGIQRMVAWVLEPSPYRKFYESLDGTLESGRKYLDIAGTKITLVSYRWNDLNHF
ncbi:MAG TPA: GNAT family N-acetyltransferase [bacterium]|jgi:GNAT superfamily N-acetyltransferase|nr:GNAT family N-acetyltransferase [bacterium]